MRERRPAMTALKIITLPYDHIATLPFNFYEKAGLIFLKKIVFPQPPPPSSPYIYQTKLIFNLII
jgi:hypothetical protein